MVSIELMSAAEFGVHVPEAGWRTVSAALTPHRLRNLAADRRWSTLFMVATVGGSPVGYLPMHRCRTHNFPAPIFDPSMVAPELFPAAGAGSFLLIGGAVDLVSAATVAVDVEPVPVMSALADGAFRYAAAQGLTGAALYVRDSQRRAFAGRAWQIDSFASLKVTGFQQYLDRLNHSRRSVVRRDWQRLEALSLRAREETATGVAAEAAPLVADIKLRHHVQDHPRMAEIRLTQWASEPMGVRVAFTVRRDDGRLLAVSFGCHHDDVLEMYEIGLDAPGEIRHLVYVEVLLYAPLQYAARAGCTDIHLGLGASRPKDLRGAVFTPVWAIGGGETGRDD